jgi:hypothetical protein
VPRSRSDAGIACWDAFVSGALTQLSARPDPLYIARAVIALAELPDRDIEMAAQTRQLRALVALRPTGAISLPAPYAEDRAARAIVLAALLRTAASVPDSPAPRIKLAGWLAMQRDSSGSYGSTTATRTAVRALLSLPETAEPPAEVKLFVEEGGQLRPFETLRLDDGASVSRALGPSAQAVIVETSQPGVIARLERPVVRSFLHPESAAAAPFGVEVVWPTHPEVKKPDLLRVSATSRLEKDAALEVRVPLPAGASLSGPVPGIRQVSGALWAQMKVPASGTPDVLSIPIRFALRGRFMVREATASLAGDDSIRAVAPARPITVD